MFDFNKAPTQKSEPQNQLTINTFVDQQKAKQQFIDDINNAGLGLQNVIADGTLHRFQTPNDKQGKQSGWYILFLDSFPCGEFGSWKEDIHQEFRYKPLNSPVYSEVERKKMEESIQRVKAERLRAKKEQQEETARKAIEIWNTTNPVDNHEYLVKKQVGSFGVRQRNDVLYVPMINESGDVRNLQRIYTDGNKKFLSGGEVKGCYSYISGDTSTIYICEGYATGATIHQVTGHAVAIAFNAGNLLDVSKILKKIITNANFVIAADNDIFTERNGLPYNPGIEKGQEAAKEIGASLVYPEFKDLSTKPTDFNDLFILEGAEQVKIQTYLDNVGLKISDWSIDIYEGKAPEVKWLVQDMIPSHSPCLLAAAGGTGKGMLSLDLALSVAEKRTLIDLNERKRFLGKEVVDHGKVVILSAEDSRDSIHQRLEVLDPTGERRKKSKDNIFIIPLPNAGGPITLVSQDGYGKVYKATPAFENLKRQLRKIKDLKLINIDPLASFVGVDINTDPQAGSFVLGLLASLCEELKTCILVSHHMSKAPKGGINTAEEARNSIRGTTALVDGVRLAIAIWQASDQKFNQAKKEIEKLEKTNLCQFAVIKTNTKADTRVYTALRNKDNGLLERYDIVGEKINKDDVAGLIIEEIKTSAEKGQPFTKTRTNSLHTRREELDERLRKLSNSRLEEIVQELLEKELIVSCTYKSTIAKFLDVPNGPFAQGIGVIEAGKKQK